MSMTWFETLIDGRRGASWSHTGLRAVVSEFSYITSTTYVPKVISFLVELLFARFLLFSLFSYPISRDLVYKRKLKQLFSWQVAG
jgi:hypothetical protein